MQLPVVVFTRKNPFRYTQQNLMLISYAFILNTVNPLNPKLAEIIFKNSVRTAKKTQHFSITKVSWLILFREIIAVYSENNAKPINTLCGHNAELLNVNSGGTWFTTCIVNDWR
jgi:hypothetical protein